MRRNTSIRATESDLYEEYKILAEHAQTNRAKRYRERIEELRKDKGHDHRALIAWLNQGIGSTTIMSRDQFTAWLDQMPEKERELLIERFLTCPDQFAAETATAARTVLRGRKRR